jgi:hypothetical protein
MRRDVLSLRVAARYQLAFEFPTPKALKDYLHEHPKADPKNHTVKKPGEISEKKTDGGHGVEHDEHEHGAGPKLTWKDLAKSLSSKAQEFLHKTPSTVKKFVDDEDHRRETLLKAHKSILSAPMKYVESAYNVAKHEVKEFKEAGEGIHAWMTGKEVSKKQKHAIREVAIHCTVAAVSGALGAGFGLGAGAVAITKGVMSSFVSSTAKKIAVKAVTKHLQHLPTLHEFGEIGHHSVELVSKLMERLASKDDRPPTQDEVFQALIAAISAKALKDLDPDTIREALEDAAGVSSEG